MKKSISIILLGLVVAAVAQLTPSIEWKETSLNLGEVMQNELRELKFEFTNTGTDPVVIVEAKGSCGCTVVDYPSNEILPGESATISANFRSNKLGQFSKTVSVLTSASEEYTHLTFTGEIIE